MPSVAAWHWAASWMGKWGWSSRENMWKVYDSDFRWYHHWISIWGGYLGRPCRLYDFWDDFRVDLWENMFSAWRYGDFLQRKQASKQFNESNDFQMYPGFYSGAVPLDGYLQTCLGSSGMGMQMGRQFFLENSGVPRSSSVYFQGCWSQCGKPAVHHLGMRFTTYVGMVYVNIRNGLWMFMALGLPGLPHHMS